MNESSWWTSAAWMTNPNVRLLLFVLSAAMPEIIGDLSADKVSWLTAAVVAANMLVAAKAFMTDPNASVKVALPSTVKMTQGP
jgi:hypothetical protein